MKAGVPVPLASALLDGLAELGTVNPFGGDLSLELGLSLWLRRSRASVHEAVAELLAVREVILDVSVLDPADEPVPLVGRSPRVDLLVLAAYVSHLLDRASAAGDSPRSSLIAEVAAALPEPSARALGA